MRPLLAAAVLLSLAATSLAHPGAGSTWGWEPAAPADVPPTATLTAPSTATDDLQTTLVPSPQDLDDALADPDGPIVSLAPRPRYIAGEEIQYRCPEGPAGLPFSPGTDVMDRTVYGCPLRVYDQTNPFGNSAIVVHEDPREMAFCALHGGPMDDGAHGYSRRGLTHTTFTSGQQGTNWADQPWGPGSNTGGAGETASCVMDRHGLLYIAYTLSHVRGEGDNKTYDSTIELFKAGSAAERGAVSAAYSDSFTIRSTTDRNPIEQAHLARVEAVFVPDDEADLQEAQERKEDEEFSQYNATANGTAPEYGEYAIPGQMLNETIILAYHEGLYGEGEQATTVVGGAMRLWWTDTGNNNTWHPALNGTEVGPCIDGSEPAVVKHHVYVACSVGAGYDHRNRARVGQIDIWRWDTRTMEAELVANTGIMGLNPRLAANDRGYMVLTTHRLVDDGTGAAAVEVRVATGWHGREWREIAGDWGAYLRQASGGRAILDADVTALSVSDDHPTGLMIFKEFHPPADLDPVAAAANGVRLTDYTKTIIAFNECDGPVAAAQVLTGTSMDAYQADAYAANPEVYNDIHDGLFHTRSPQGEELWYFSINDYGAMLFGAVIVASASDPGCFILPPPPLVPPPPLQPLAFANPYTLPAGLAFGAVATAMVGYALAAKRRNPLTIAAEDN